MMPEGKPKKFSSPLVSPPPAKELGENSRKPRRRRSRDQRIGELQDQLKENGLDIASVAEACSEAVAEEICEAGLQIAKTSNHQRLQLLLDEKERIVDVRYFQEQKHLCKDKNNGGKENAENDSGETSSSSSGEAGGGRSLENDGPDGSETDEESNSQKEDPNFFEADFEQTGNTSDIESMVDSIEYFARSFSGLSFLSDVGFEDVSQKEFENIEEKVIEEYGIDYIQKYEEKHGDDAASSEDSSGEELAEASVKQNTTATTAEILDDIINAEREGKEVVYDPNRKESSGRSLARSLKSLRLIRSASTRSFRKDKKMDHTNKIKIQKPEDALETRAAAAALADSMIMDDTRQEEDNVAKDQGTNNSVSNPVSEKPSLRYSCADTDDMLAESGGPQRREKLTILVDTTKEHTESFVQGNGNQETVLDRSSSVSSSVHRQRSRTLSSSNSVGKAPAYNPEEELMDKIAISFEGSESGSQHEYQNLELIHSLDGPLIRSLDGSLIRLPPIHRTSSFRSASSIGSSAYYDNKEVVYDPKAFGNASRRSFRSRNIGSCALVKKNNNCCDLREIATSLRPRSQEDKQKVVKRRSESINSDTSISKKPWKIIEDDENQVDDQSNQHDQSHPPTEFEGVEMQLNLDCFDIAGSKKRWIKKEMNRPTSFGKNKRRFLDPERLFCGLKPIQRQPVVAGEKATKAAKNTKSKSRKTKVVKPSSSEAESDSIPVEAANPLQQEEEFPEKEKEHNISIDTALTVPTEDEDTLSQFQVEVTDISTMSSKDPFVSALLQETRSPSMESRKSSNSRKLRKSRSREYFPMRKYRSREYFSDTDSRKSDNNSTVNVMDVTRITVTTGIQESASAHLPREPSPAEANKPTFVCPVPIVSEDQPDSLQEVMACPVPGSEKTKPKYGGELVDLLHQISSYVDGIVEKNNYSLGIPSTQPRDASESKKDGNDADDERSLPRSNVEFEANSSVSALSSVALSKEGILGAIYVPTSRTPEKKAEIQKISHKDEASEQRKADLLSLFDNSPTRSESSHSTNGKNSDPPRALMDDELSDNSSAIVGSSVERSVNSEKPSQHQPEEPQEIWEENPVVYHMKSSPPQAKRNMQKRTPLKRTVERYPLRVKTRTTDIQKLAPKAKPIDVQKLDPKAKPIVVQKLVPKAKPIVIQKVAPEAKPIDGDDDDDSVGSLPYHCVKNAKPKTSLETKPMSEEAPQPSQPSQCNSADDDDDSFGSLPYHCVKNAKPKAALEKKPVREEIPETSQPSQRNSADDDDDSVGSLPYSCVTNAKPKKSLETKPVSDPQTSQPPPVPLESTSRRTPPSYREVRRPPTPPNAFREANAVGKSGFSRTNSQTSSKGGNPESDNKTSTQTNGYIVDEHGFVLHKTADLLEDLDDTASFIEELESGSVSSNVRSHKSTTSRDRQGRSVRSDLDKPFRTVKSDPYQKLLSPPV